MNDNHSGGGSSAYYELPRGPNGEYPQTINQVIKWSKMSWAQANIFKAAYRWEKKAGIQYNCEKVIWFARDTLDDIYAEQKKALK